jgi:NAD(P)-dependent dehydrogenase (short-subunit alcohol dehydrogenase family)
LALLRAGWTVVLAGRREHTLKQTAALVAGSKSLCLVADVRDPASVESLFAKVKANFGRLDLLFNNAGVNAPAVPTEDLSIQQWQLVVDTNLTGIFLCTQQAIRIMKAQNPRGGRIINNGSVAAQTPRPDGAAYTATKHAITGLTKSVALDGRKHDIACGQIDIGNAMAEMPTKMQPHGAIVKEPVFDPSHVGEAVVYMAGLPLDTNVMFMTIMATKMPLVGRG